MPKPAHSKKIDPAIVIAVIGLIGTLLTALLASPVLITWIQKSNSLANTPTQTLPLPASATATVVTATAIASPTITPPITPTLVGQDWKSIIKLRIQGGCLATSWLLSPTINPAENISAANQQIIESLHNNDANRSFVNPAGMFIDISSIVADKEWIKISNKLLIDVVVQNNLLENVNVLTYDACGGEGKDRSFPMINLSNDFLTYSLGSVFPDADFFTLQPGEFESFALPMKCSTIGIYQLKVNVSYEYSSISNITNSDQTFEAVCPRSFISWDFNGSEILSSQAYRWNGNGYDKVP